MTQAAGQSSRVLRFHSAVNRAFIGLCGVLLLSLSVMIVIDVIYRYFSGRPLVGVYEISGLILLATIFFAFGFVELNRQHITIDIIPNLARKGMKAFLDCIDAICGLIVFSIILYTSGVDAIESYEFSFSSGGMLRIPLYVPFTIIFIGSLLMCVALLVKFLTSVFFIIRRKSSVSGG